MGRTKLRGFAWAGVRVAVEMPANMEWDLPAPLAERACQPGGADVYVSASWLDDCPGPLASRPGFQDAHYSHEGGAFEVGRERGEHWVHVARDGRIARFDADFEWARIQIPRSAARSRLFPLQAPLDDLVLIHRTLAAGGLALRATAAVREGGALVILGDRSPEVESPRTRLWRGWLLVRPARDSILVHPLPSTLRSEVRASDAAGVRLDGLHVTNALGADGAAILDPDLAAGEVLRYAFAPLANPKSADQLVAAATRLTESVSVLRLSSIGGRAFEWRSARSTTSLAPPAGA
jgi:hypothetical protein